jgi:molybdenum cofactor cytidylyltransferase
MGRTKQLLPWGDGTMLQQTLHNVRASRVQQIVVVTGYRAAEVGAIARAAGAVIVHNPDYEDGEMLSSLQVAIRQLPADCQAVLVVLADQPLVEPGTFDQLLTAYEKSGASIVAPVYQGRRGNPVLFDRVYFAELLALPRGAAPRDLLVRHDDALFLVPVDSPSVLLDIDRPEDYAEHRPGEGPNAS